MSRVILWYQAISCAVLKKLPIALDASIALLGQHLGFATVGAVVAFLLAVGSGTVCPFGVVVIDRTTGIAHLLGRVEMTLLSSQSMDVRM